MKLSHEEIKEASKQCDWCHLSSFIAGARFAESRLLPFVEANDYLIIDTAEKKKACEPQRFGDEFWNAHKNAWDCVFADEDKANSYAWKFSGCDIYRRPIRWHAVKDTPVPKGMPVWYWNANQERAIFTPDCVLSSATHWRYAVIPAPPQIDKEREAFEAQFILRGLPNEVKENCFELWQAAQSAARKEGK